MVSNLVRCGALVKRKKRKKRQVKPEVLELIQSCPYQGCEARKRCWMPENCWAKPSIDPTMPIRLDRRFKSCEVDLDFEEFWQLEDEED